MNNGIDPFAYALEPFKVQEIASTHVAKSLNKIYLRLVAPHHQAKVIQVPAVLGQIRTDPARRARYEDAPPPLDRRKRMISKGERFTHVRGVYGLGGPERDA